MWTFLRLTWLELTQLGVVLNNPRLHFDWCWITWDLLWTCIVRYCLNSSRMTWPDLVANHWTIWLGLILNGLIWTLTRDLAEIRLWWIETWRRPVSSDLRLDLHCSATLKRLWQKHLKGLPFEPFNTWGFYSPAPLWFPVCLQLAWRGRTLLHNRKFIPPHRTHGTSTSTTRTQVAPLKKEFSGEICTNL